MWPGLIQDNYDGPLVPMVRLVPIENDVIPMVLLVNKARSKYKHAMCILRSISHLCKTSSLLHQVKTRYIYTNRYDSSNRWSIGTNGRIGTNRKWCHSNGSIGEYASYQPGIIFPCDLAGLRGRNLMSSLISFQTLTPWELMFKIP